MQYDVQLPGAASASTVIETSLFGIRHVAVGGIPAQRSDGKGKTFLIPLAAGGTGRLSYRFGFTRSHMIFEGQKIPIGRALKPLEIAVVLLPFGLAGLFGAVGGGVGAVLAAVNAALVRSELPAPIRYLLTLGGPALVGLVLFFVIVGFRAGVFITPDWEKAGMCWKTLPEGEEVEHIVTTDCASPHAAEVYAVPQVRPEEIGGTYSADGLDKWGLQACYQAFSVFVGLSYEQSRYDFYYLVPTQMTWTVGDRLIVCAVYDPGGDQLVGSVRGSAQ